LTRCNRGGRIRLSRLRNSVTLRASGGLNRSRRRARPIRCNSFLRHYGSSRVPARGNTALLHFPCDQNHRNRDDAQADC